MKNSLLILAASAALIGASSAQAAPSASVAPGAAANGTTPGALGNGTNQSLQAPTTDNGLGYNPTAPSSWGYAERPGFPDLQPERCDAARDRIVCRDPRQHRFIRLRRRHRWHGEYRRLGLQRIWQGPGETRRALFLCGPLAKA